MKSEKNIEFWSASLFKTIPIVWYGQVWGLYTPSLLIHRTYILRTGTIYSQKLKITTLLDFRKIICESLDLVFQQYDINSKYLYGTPNCQKPTKTSTDIFLDLESKKITIFTQNRYIWQCWLQNYTSKK